MPSPQEYAAQRLAALAAESPSQASDKDPEDRNAPRDGEERRRHRLHDAEKARFNLAEYRSFREKEAA